MEREMKGSLANYLSNRDLKKKVIRILTWILSKLLETNWDLKRKKKTWETSTFSIHIIKHASVVYENGLHQLRNLPFPPELFMLLLRAKGILWGRNSSNRSMHATSLHVFGCLNLSSWTWALNFLHWPLQFPYPSS